MTAPAPARLKWDAVGERTYETGVDRGVLYVRGANGTYPVGVPWNGLTGVTETPGGASANPLYADNIKYLNLIATETLDGTITAYTYPDEFAECDGTGSPAAGIAVGQQGRKTFGLTYRTRKGNDEDGVDHGYKLHLLYGSVAAPAERAYASINDTPDAINFSWGFSTSPVDVTGFKPTSLITIDSTTVDAAELAVLEDAIWGSDTATAHLPLPDEVIAMFAAASAIAVTPTAPTYDQPTHVITIPTVTGVVYEIGGVPVTGSQTIAADTTVTAVPDSGYVFTAGAVASWTFVF